MEEYTDSIVKMRLLFTLFLAVLISGCSDTPEQPGVTDVNNQLAGEKTAPTEYDVSIVPTDATVESALSVRFRDSLIGKGELSWYVNESQSDIQGMRFSSPNLRKGDVVQAVVRNKSKEFYSNKVIIRNTPPIISRASIIPAIPKTTNILSVDISTRDSDGDTVHYSYKWSMNGEHISNEETLVTELTRGDSIKVEVTPNDGDDTGIIIVLESKIYNSLPTLTGTDPTFDGKVYKYTVSATDPDGDTLTYALRNAPESMSIDSKSGAITWEVKPEELGLHDFEVSVKDDHGGEVIMPVTTNLGIAETS